jgi:hypothetical protein
MTQDERWHWHYDQIMFFMRKNRRCPSKYYAEDIAMHNWIKYNKKVYHKGLLPADRVKKFETLLKKAAQYRRINQFQYLEEQ